MSNKLSHFWQELKRRNVIRVITVYTGAAFVILSLVDMIREPFELPNWSFKLVIVLLAIGLIIAVILSWIYDIHPEGGMVKTESADKTKPDEHPGTSKGWKIASYISFVVIVGLVVLNVIPRAGKNEIRDNSVAVLPFINESQDQENEHFLNGIMDELCRNLQSIEGLRVPGRTSMEQYRNNPKSIPEIAKEMDVGYVVECTGQLYGEKFRLGVTLVEGETDTQIWSHSYEKVITGTEDIYSIEIEIAQSIATELKVVITPEEKQLIEKVPTTSLMANELYQRGRDEYVKFLLDVRDKEALTSAQGYFLKALDEDPVFAKACAGMAMTMYSRLIYVVDMTPIYSEGYLEVDAFDSVYFWADKALDIDRKLPEAYYARGNYYFETGDREKAEKDYHKAIGFNPNYWEAYYGLGQMYFSMDFIEVFKYFQKSASLVRGPELSYLLSVIIQTYAFSGTLELAESRIADYLNLTQDSLVYYRAKSSAEMIKGNLDNEHHWLTMAYDYDSTNPTVLSDLAESYVKLGHIEEGLRYYQRNEDINQKLRRIEHNELHRIGYAYYRAGNTEEADYYFDRQEEISKRLIDLKRPWEQYGLAQLDLALIYAFRGEKSKAMNILRDLHQKPDHSYFIDWYIQDDPMLDALRDDPEFQQIANDLAIRLQDEIASLRQWLEENDML